MISVDKVSVAFRGKAVLDELTFQLAEGEILGLVAPNGTGKSTLLNVLMNYVTPISGQVTVDDIRYQSMNHERRIRELISLMPDQSDLYDYLTGVEHLKVYQKMWANTSLELESVIDMLQMQSYVRAKVGTYSLGMRQRLCFAMQIVANTKYLLMDEVMNGLDPTNVELLSNILLEKKAEGKSIVIASHLLTNLDEYADRVYFLKSGRFVHEVRKAGPKELVIKFASDQTKASMLGSKEIKVLPNGTSYIDLADGEEWSQFSTLLQEYQIQQFEVAPIDLNDLYSYYFER